MNFVYSYTDHPLVRDQPELSTHYNQSSGDFLFLCEGKVSAENASQSFVVWSVDGKRVEMSAINATDDRKFTAEISYRDLVNFTYGSKVGFDIWQVFAGKRGWILILLSFCCRNQVLHHKLYFIYMLL